jgi:hypothetical protein
MLETAFHNKIPKDLMKVRGEGQNKIWSYSGRFLYGFALIEYQVDQLFNDLIKSDVYSIVAVLVNSTLDLRKKLKVIEVIFKSKDIDEGETFDRIHEFHDLRNVVAHWPFSYDESRDALWCDYYDKSGTEFRRPGTTERDRIITLAEFDAYDAQLAELYKKLEELEMSTIPPVTNVDVDLRVAIEQAIDAAGNIVRFPVKPQIR